MINTQAPGPLEGDSHGDLWCVSDKASHAQVAHPAVSAGSHIHWGFCNKLPDLEQANADLALAAYNAFDKAARALGVDATELATKLPLLDLIRCTPGIVRYPGTKSGTRCYLEDSFDITKHLTKTKCPK